MYVPQACSVAGILEILKIKIQEKLPSCPHGLDIEITEHKKIRSYQQNRFYRAVLDNIVQFCDQTGFSPKLLGVVPARINSDLLHELVKLHYNIASTAKLSTAEFAKFIDGLQLEITTQSKGNYDPIYPDDPYMQSLLGGAL